MFPLSSGGLLIDLVWRENESLEEITKFKKVKLNSPSTQNPPIKYCTVTLLDFYNDDIGCPTPNGFIHYGELGFWQRSWAYAFVVAEGPEASLFCGTQVTRVVGPLELSAPAYSRVLREGWPPGGKKKKKMAIFWYFFL